MSNDELLPCPFCGSEVNLSGWGWISIKCWPCGIEIENRDGRRDNEDHVRRLIKKWNTRKGNDSIKAEGIRDAVGEMEVLYHSGCEWESVKELLEYADKLEGKQ